MKLRICIDPLLLVRDWSVALDCIDYINSLAEWDQVGRDLEFAALEVDSVSYAEYCRRLSHLEAQRSGWRKDAARIVLGFVSRRVRAVNLEGDVAGEFLEQNVLAESTHWAPGMQAEFCDLLADASVKGDAELPRGTIASTIEGSGFLPQSTSIGIRALCGDSISEERCSVTRSRAELLGLLDLPDPLLLSKLRVDAVPEAVYEQSGHQPTPKQKRLIEQVALRSGIVVRAGTTYYNPNGKVRLSSISRTDQDGEILFTIVDAPHVVKGIYAINARNPAESDAAYRHLKLTLMAVEAEI